MTVEMNINLNMTSNQAPVVVDAVQNEQLTRVISATLYDGAKPWSVPKNVKAGLAFRKPDGTGGLYDELPDKYPAVMVDGNTVKATLAPQVQSVAGDVAVAIVFTDASKLHRLATFPFIVRVAKDPSAGSETSNDYYKYSTMEEVNAAIKDVQASANAATEAVAGFHQAVASAIPITLAGAAVSADMVSPVEHRVQCKISGLPDLTAVKVFQYNNLLDGDAAVKLSNSKGVFIYDTYKLLFYTGENSLKIPVPVPIASDLTFMLGIKPAAKAKNRVSFGCVYTDGTDEILDGKLDFTGNEGLTYLKLHTRPDKIVRYIYSMYTNGHNAIIDLRHAAILIGDYKGESIDTEFSKFTVFSPDSKGIISNMKSIYPMFSIVTDNQNVTIEANYNTDTKKYIDKKFEALQAAILSTGGNV